MTSKPADLHPIASSAVTHWDLEADVLVVGFGSAGASAAIEAATSGASVALFEVASGFGGTSAMAGGDIYLGGGGGTSAQRASGFEDETEDFFRYMMMSGGPDADEERVRLYADGALAHFEWLKAQGVPYRDTHIPGKTMVPGTGDCLMLSGSEYAWPFREQAKPCPRGHLPEAVGEAGGFLLVQTLAKRVEALGVDVHYDSRAQQLVVDEDRRVVGLVVRSGDQTRFARARGGVVLCTGGFALNEDMLERYAPLRARLGDTALSGGHDDGSGIQLGLSVGAAAIHMDELFLTLPIYPPASHVKGMLINDKGARFINEDAYPGRVAHYIVGGQIGERFYLLVDDALFEKPAEFSQIEIACVGETWEEVEAELELPAGTLTASVEVYNRHAAKGEDPLFHKAPEWLKPLDQPPFAALACHLREAYYPFFTLGGLEARSSGEVVDTQGAEIPGLYAAGRTACGLPRWGPGYSSGMSLGDCTFFGRLAGASAAKRAGR